MDKNDMRQRIDVISNKPKLWQQRLWAAVLVLLAAWASNTQFVAQANTNMPKPVIEAAVDKQLMDQWGIELLGVRWSAAGYMLDFRYRVVDPEKAAPILLRSVQPYIVVEKSGVKLAVPFSEKVGSLRQSVRTANQVKKNRIYFSMFANPGRHVKVGDKVTVVIGEFNVKHLAVQ